MGTASLFLNSPRARIWLLMLAAGTLAVQHLSIRCGLSVVGGPVASEEQLSVVLSEFALTMVTDFPVEGILERLVGRIVDMLPISAAGVTLISPSSNPHYIAASDEAALRYEKLQSELGEGPCLAAYRTGEAVAVPDLKEDDRFRIFGPRAVEVGLAAVFTFPLRQGDKRLGALDLYRGTTGPLDDDDMAAAQTLADVTAAYVVNAQAREGLRDTSELSLHRSLHDPLTGLPNRTLLVERLEHGLLRDRRSKKAIAVLFADLDGFKMVNDVHGHQAGDTLLIEVARRLKSLLRPGDTVARISGDEFVMVCEDLSEEAQAQVIAKRVADALSLSFDVSGTAVTVSASVGIAFAQGDADPEQLLEDADVAMYQAKRKGGGHHQVVDLRERHQVEYRNILQRDLRGAAERGELTAEYQPIVRTDDGRLVGAEALLRWSHPTRGAIAPMTLIPLAEQAGLIGEIGRWVLVQACTDRRRSASAGRGNFGMAVNVSAHQLLERDFVASVAVALSTTSTRPELLTLEITESALIHDSERALVVLNQLKQLGVMLALDDFGTGHSSLVYLARFPIYVVKIDRAFTSALAYDRVSHVIVAKVIELAHELGMTVVSEGVETPEQLREVAALGSECCQGFYFARPMTADSLDALTRDAARLKLVLPIPA